MVLFSRYKHYNVRCFGLVGGKFSSVSIRSIFIVISLFSVLLWTCSSEQPLSPEDIIHQYAQYINQGKLEQAKNISTSSGQAYIDALSEIIIASATSLDTTEIHIKTIQCKQTNTGMHCISLEYDGFEEYENEYWLVQTETGWLVDRPAAEGTVKNTEEILEKKE